MADAGLVSRVVDASNELNEQKVSSFVRGHLFV